MSPVIRCACSGSSRKRAVAAPSHPHICTLHDIGHQDGTDFLVMEFLEGETLAARIARRRPPFDQGLQYGFAQG
jgi:eukaryotic-like serine/threonine-protein kinase